MSENTENYVIEDRVVPVGKMMVINGRNRGAGYKYKIKVRKDKPVEKGENNEL